MSLIKISEAAAQLGVCSEHIRRMIRAGKWPVYKLGPKATRLDVEEIRKLSKAVVENKGAK